jgi:DNA-binding FadR family transcriptional regulator
MPTPDPRPRSVAAGRALAVAEEMVYAPLAAEDLNEMAARRIAEAIGLGLLEVGDRLPPETELAERFGIAPMTLRDALSVLRDAGYIETRRGRGGGTFIRSVHPRPRTGAETPPLEELSLADIRDIADAREAVEGAAAALAAQRASSEHIGELQTLVETMAQTTDFDAFRRIDSRFHITLSVSGGSRRLTELVTRIQAELRGILAFSPHPAEGLGFTNGQHRAILAAVVKGDADAARASMVTHVRDTTEYMIQLRLSVGQGPAEGPARPGPDAAA